MRLRIISVQFCSFLKVCFLTTTFLCLSFWDVFHYYCQKFQILNTNNYISNISYISSLKQNIKPTVPPIDEWVMCESFTSRWQHNQTDELVSISKEATGGHCILNQQGSTCYCSEKEAVTDEAQAAVCSVSDGSPLEHRNSVDALFRNRDFFVPSDWIFMMVTFTVAASFAEEMHQFKHDESNNKAGVVVAHKLHKWWSE